MSISGEACQNASITLQRERNRFRIGEGAAIDTLRASLEFLKVQQTLLSDSTEESRKRHELAVALMMSADSIQPPDSVVIHVAQLPDSAEFRLKLEKYNPSYRILQIIMMGTLVR